MKLVDATSGSQFLGGVNFHGWEINPVRSFYPAGEESMICCKLGREGTNAKNQAQGVKHTILVEGFSTQ